MASSNEEQAFCPQGSVYIISLDPSDRVRREVFPVLRMNAFNHVKSLFGSNGFYPVYPSRFLSLVVLRDPSHCEHSRCPGLHSQLLHFLDCSLVATLFGSKDALLYPGHMLLKRAPGVG